LRGLSKAYDDAPAIQNLNLDMKDKEFVVLLGPSGCGKTTTLRCVAGLESPDAGSIYIGERLVNDLDPKERNVAMVFQSYALYPHMTAYKNIAFPLENARASEQEINERVNRVARLLQIEGLLGRKPSQLSGGQRQRVALGRAIVREPDVFLMDEPLSNLDAKLRVHMRAELKKLQKVLGVTTIYVTHDQVEAMTMADRVALLDKGVLQQYDGPRNLYSHPTNQFAAGFIGSPPINLIDCDLVDGSLLDAADFSVPVPGQFADACQRNSPSSLVLGARPQDIRVSTTAESGILAGANGGASPADAVRAGADPEGPLEAIALYNRLLEIYTTEPLGDSTILDVKIGDKLLKAIAAATFEGDAGLKVWIRFVAERTHLFNRSTGDAIA